MVESMEAVDAESRPLPVRRRSSGGGVHVLALMRRCFIDVHRHRIYAVATFIKKFIVGSCSLLR